MRDLAAIVDAFVTRLREEEVVPGADTLRPSQLADHVAAYVADIAAVLGVIECALEIVDLGSEMDPSRQELRCSRAREGWQSRECQVDLRNGATCTVVPNLQEKVWRQIDRIDKPEER